MHHVQPILLNLLLIIQSPRELRLARVVPFSHNKKLLVFIPGLTCSLSAHTLMVVVLLEVFVQALYYINWLTYHVHFFAEHFTRISSTIDRAIMSSPIFYSFTTSLHMLHRMSPFLDFAHYNSSCKQLLHNVCLKLNPKLPAIKPLRFLENVSAPRTHQLFQHYLPFLLVKLFQPPFSWKIWTHRTQDL